jgi:protein arginine N-methyltransferase 3
VLPESPEEILPLLVRGSSFLTDETYLKPVLANDALLFSDWGCNQDSDSDEKMSGLDDQKARGASSVSPTETITRLQNENMALQAQLAAAREAMQAMSETMQRVVSDGKHVSASSVDNQDTSSSSSDDDEKPGDAKEKKIEKERRQAENDYFGGYSVRDIHELMLRDTARTLAYRDFMYENKALFHDKVVLDIGCGTGILSMFAARAGARKVIGIDRADIIDKARLIVADNHLQDTITLIKSKVEEAELPVSQVDIIISEWMGYFLLYESMLPSVLFARDRYLAPGGYVFPSAASMYIAGAELAAFKQHTQGFWQDVYGFDMRVLLDPSEKHPSTTAQTINMNNLITSTATLQVAIITIVLFCFRFFDKYYL